MLNKEGVTPIIGVIFLLMLTVAIVGATYSWISSTQQSMEVSAQRKIQKTSEKIKTRFLVPSLTCEEGENYDLVKARIRNTGSSDIEKGTEVLSKLEYGGEPLGSKVLTLEKGIKQGEVSGTLIFNFTDNPTNHTNQEHTVILNIGAIEKMKLVNCTG